MKKILICLVILLLCGCSKLDEESKKCLTDLSNGLVKRWDAVNVDYSSYEEYQSNILSGIELELNTIQQYENSEFNNEEFTTIIKQYIMALKNQQTGIHYIFSDTQKYNELYVENGLYIRKEFGFEVDENYSKNFEEVLNSNYKPLIQNGEKVCVSTQYGDFNIAFTGFDILAPFTGQKELVLYCEVENLSYNDEYNGQSILVEQYIGMYDVEGYKIPEKYMAYDYIDGYEECAGLIDIRQGQKGKFAIIYDYNIDIDIVYLELYGQTETRACYLTAGDWIPLEERNANYVKGSSLTEEDALVFIGKPDETMSKYDNNMWKMLKGEYGGESVWYFYDDDGDSTGVEDIEGMKTYRDIVLGESSDNDVVNAYGGGNVTEYQYWDDPLYDVLDYSNSPTTKYLEDTEMVRFYTYKKNQIAFYIDSHGKVDLIAYFYGTWY